ncbi:MAG: immunoglobulin-like domain-containing protein [Treponema sp.]
MCHAIRRLRGGGAIDTPNPQKVKDEAAVKTVKDALTVQEIVGKAQNKIILPKGGEGVTVTWTSNKSDLIDSEGNVTHKDGEGVDEVELTATITKGEASVKKTFTVKIAQKNKVLSTEEILDSVTIPVNYDKTKYEAQDIDVQESILVEDKTVTIEYTSSNDEKHLRYNSSTKKITVHRDIIDVTAQLSVKLTCEGKEKTKQIPVLIERIPEFIKEAYGTITTFAFDGTTLTETNSTSSWSGGSKFAYTVDTKNEIITVSKTHTFRNGEFLDKEKYINAQIAEFSKFTSSYKKAYEQPNLENLRVLFNYNDANLKNDDELIDYILKNENIRKHFDGITETSTKDDFKALAEDKKKKGIKNCCEEMLKEGAAYHNISDALPYLEMLKKVEAAAIAKIRKEISKEFFTNIKYKYIVSSESYKSTYPKGVWFEAKYIYDENRSWYENSYYGSWYGIWQDVYGTWNLKVGSNIYYGKFNSDYTEFTYSKKKNDGTGQTYSENGKWIFEKPVAAPDGKVSMKAKKSGPLEEVTLEFHPYQL